MTRTRSLSSKARLSAGCAAKYAAAADAPGSPRPPESLLPVFRPTGFVVAVFLTDALPAILESSLTTPDRCALCGPLPRLARRLWRSLPRDTPALRGAFRLRSAVHPMRLRPLVPLRDRLLHRPQEVVRAAVADELEALLQVTRERLVVGEGAEMLLEADGALE